MRTTPLCIRILRVNTKNVNDPREYADGRNECRNVYRRNAGLRNSSNVKISTVGKVFDGMLIGIDEKSVDRFL